MWAFFMPSVYEPDEDVGLRLFMAGEGRRFKSCPRYQHYRKARNYWVSCYADSGIDVISKQRIILFQRLQ